MDSFIPRLSFDDFKIIKHLRKYFDSLGWEEVLWPETVLTILAACEDPANIGTFNYNGEVWPLNQTQQMQLEVYLMKNPNLKGLHIQTTSYRNEPEPIPGRHDKIFPMYEFESHGDMERLIEVEEGLMKYLGFPLPLGKDHYPKVSYEEACIKYNVSEITGAEEFKLEEDYGSVVFLYDFPAETYVVKRLDGDVREPLTIDSSSPFWNMRVHPEGNLSKKVDVIIGGMETIGSAERSCDPEEMLHQFETISGGQYARTLYALFTKKRVHNELEEFLALPFMTRMGGGCGIRRLITALQKYGLYDQIVAQY